MVGGIINNYRLKLNAAVYLWRLVKKIACMVREFGLAVTFLLFYNLSVAQPAEPRFSGNFENQTFTQVLQVLTRQFPGTVFYREEELPDFKDSWVFQNQPLPQVLDHLLAKTTLGYLTYQGYLFVIMPKTTVNEVYTVDYYKAYQALTNASNPDDQAIPKIVIGQLEQVNASARAKITGVISDEQTREPIVGATVYWEDLKSGTASEADGSFETEVPVGEHNLLVQYVGYDNFRRKVVVYQDGPLNLSIVKEAINLDEVTVRAQAANASVQNAQVGVQTLDVKSVNKIASLLGEADIIKNLLLYPGVSTVGEGALGFNVRGGQVDQNLILQDDGIVFNPSHALGFFSTFNHDIIQGVDLYKGNMPAEFGGRIASVLDVEMKDGSFEQFKAKASISPVSAKISAELPVVKGVSSLLGSFRSSYINWILDATRILSLKNSSSFFYDANLRYTQKIGQKNTLILSGYASQDEFFFNNEFGFDYDNRMGQVILKSIFSPRFFSRFSFTINRYLSSQYDLAGLDGARQENNINYLQGKQVFSYIPRTGLRLDLGLSSVLYLVDPGKRSPYGEDSEIAPVNLDQEKGLESAVFINSEWSVSDQFQINAGLRGVLYQFLGPQTLFTYQNMDRPDRNEITGTKNYAKGTIKSYTSIEPRISLRLNIDDQSSLKAGYSRTAQFLNQIFNTDSPTPNSYWQLANPFIAPSRSHNGSVGWFRNFSNNNWETSLEIYGRLADKVYDYRDFAELNVNDHIETELLAGVGRAYGAEVSIKKKEGILNGWISYTLSRSERQISEINKGKWYPSNFDKPHDVSLVFNWQPNKRNTLNVNFNYGTGRPNNSPIAIYKSVNGLIIPVYTERNQLRIPDYHRLDIAYTLGRGYKRDRRFRTSWTISVYNVYARRNAFSVYFTRDDGRIPEANRLTILGTALPALTFNLEVQ